MSDSNLQPEAASATVTCRDLSKWYGPVLGLGGVSLEFRPGVTGLLGPNGAGKSTLLKLLTGQLRPSKGVARVHGRDPWSDVAAVANVGFAPEEDAFYEHLTPLGFVAGLTRLHGYSSAEAKARAARAIAEVGLEEQVARTRPLSGCSRGMRQRAKLAQAIAHDPDVVVLDEPLNGVDPLSRQTLMDLIRHLGERGCTVIVSSHVLHEVEAMTQAIVLMSEGRLLADGDVETLRGLIDEHPHTIRVTVAEPRRLAREALGWDHVVAVRLETERSFVVETRAPDDAYTALPRAARELGLQIQALTSPDNNLAALFRYLVG